MFRTRIAPTPSGYLHLGNACNFLLAWLWARTENGRLLLRIDDLDRARMRQEYVEDVFRTLDWLGIHADEGPSGPDDFYQNWSQHLRLDRYQQALDQLVAAAKLFACDCSRSQLMADAPDGQYPGNCRLAAKPLQSPPFAWRILTTPDAAARWEDVWQGTQNVSIWQEMRDFVVRRKDGLPAYQLASLVDDLDLGVNAIVRGADLHASTGAQLWLGEQLGRPLTVVRWAHHPLLADAQGNKLSKSAGSDSLLAMRETERSPARVYQQCARLIGLEGDIATLDELLAAYTEYPKFTSK